VRDATRQGTTVVDAELDCTGCGNVGVVRSHRPMFLPDDLGDGWAPHGLAERRLDLRRIGATSGTWLPHAERALIATEVGSCLAGATSEAGVVVTLGTHTWGGRARVRFGTIGAEADLYSADPSFRRMVLRDADATPPLAWSVVLAPGHDERRSGDQAIVLSIAELVPAADAPLPEFVPVNDGNPYPARFGELLAALPDDAIVIDVGGGDRRHPDPRVLNFEYLKFDGPDFFGDGLHLPIADRSVDLILSQAVLEHVPEPQRAVDELRRILKPDGRIFCEFAFMQPLHAVPYHFFNITPHGAQLLFRDWDVHHTGTFGGLSSTMSWFFRLLDADRRIGPDAARSVIDHLATLDATLDAAALEFVASAVYVEAGPGTR
jgi:SAM-dependent methyltransferase